MFQLKLFLLVMLIMFLCWLRIKARYSATRYASSNDFSRVRDRTDKHPRDIAGVPKNPDAFSGYVGDDESLQTVFMPGHSLLRKADREQYLKDTKVFPQSESEWMVNRERANRAW